MHGGSKISPPSFVGGEKAGDPAAWQACGGDGASENEAEASGEGHQKAA